MSIEDAIQLTFSEVIVGSEFTRMEIIRLVNEKYKINEGSIIPSDYCYNRTNKGINFNRNIHLFEFLGKGFYKYIGDKYRYTGDVKSKSIGEPEKVVGQWKDGYYTDIS